MPDVTEYLNRLETCVNTACPSCLPAEKLFSNVFNRQHYYSLVKSCYWEKNSSLCSAKKSCESFTDDNMIAHVIQ